MKAVMVVFFAVVALASAAEVREKRGFLAAPAVVAAHTYAAPAIGYAAAAPAVSYAAPAVSYAAPALSYAAPAVGYAAPLSYGSYAAPALTTGLAHAW